MLKRAEIDAYNNPRRAKLLREAISQGKEKHIRLQLETLVKLLATEKLRRAQDNQTTVRNDLQSLLVRGGSAVIVRRRGGGREILTKYDLIHALTRG